MKMPYCDFTRPLPAVIRNQLSTGRIPLEGVLRDTTRDAVLNFPSTITDWVNQAMASTTFQGFTDAIEQAHNLVHVSFGGDMANIGYSAFDPAFWFVHCNVDRMWALWQSQNPNEEIPNSLTIGEERQSFGFRGLAVDEKPSTLTSFKALQDMSKSAFSFESVVSFVIAKAFSKRVVLKLHNAEMSHIPFIATLYFGSTQAAEFAFLGMNGPMKLTKRSHTVPLSSSSFKLKGLDDLKTMLGDMRFAIRTPDNIPAGTIEKLAAEFSSYSFSLDWE